MFSAMKAEVNDHLSKAQATLLHRPFHQLNI